MSNSTFHILNETMKIEAMQEISVLPPNEMWVVQIKRADEARTAAQLRLKWLWMRQLEKEMAGIGSGRDHFEWNQFFKGKFMRELLISQDEEYVDFYKNADLVVSRATNKNWAKGIIIDTIKTEWLSMENMRAFMFKIDQYVLTEMDIQLFIPGELRWMAPVRPYGLTLTSNIRLIA